MVEHSKLIRFRKYINYPWIAGVMCSLLVFITRPLGEELGQAFRRLVDHIVSRSDYLFEYAASSNIAATNIHAIQAWGAWIIFGFVSAYFAMLITRWLARSPISWGAVFIVLVLWLALYLLVWNWDADMQFPLARAASGVGQVWGPWPSAGSFGYFGGMFFGLVLAATPWRARTL